MNKKVSTLLVATLLAAGPAFTAAYAANKPVAVQYAVGLDAIKLADGAKFYLNADGNYLTVKEVTLNDKETKVWTLGKAVKATDSTVPAEAAVFEVRSYSSVDNGSVFELWVNGNKVEVSKKTGGAVTSDMSQEDVISKYFTKATTANFLQHTDAIYTYSVGGYGQEFGAGLYGVNPKAYTAQLSYTEEDLNDYNRESTTLSFDFAKDELVGNEFNQLIPYTNNTVTYFVKGEKADKFDLNNPETFKGISILAVDHKNRYGLNTSKAGEGYKLRMVDAEKFLLNEEGKLLSTRLDSLTLAGFTNILEADQLNKAKELTLNVAPKAGLLQDVKVATVFNIAAVKSSTSDTKAYVTTVAPKSSSWAVVKNAILGDNTYFPASEFLKEGVRTVAILNVTGKPGDLNYYKYLVEDNQTYKAASELDFTMPQNQWVITGFDGKYTITLQNRLDNTKTLILDVVKSDKGYKTRIGSDVVEVKFLDLATKITDGYTTFTEEQVKDGVNLSFYGETALAGKKEFFAVRNGNVVEPALESGKAVVLKPVRNLDTQKVDEFIQVLTSAALDANGKVVSVKDTLVVPTYTLATEVKDGKVVSALATNNSTYSIVDAASATSYALAKNKAGEYSLVPVVGKNVKEVAKDPITGVGYHSYGFYFNTIGRTVKADIINEQFANVAVTSVNKLNESLPAVPGHYTFDNLRGSINVTDVKGINEGALATEGQVFWLDTADIEKAHPSFYISFGKDGVAARNYMFNPIDSAKVFDEYTASFKFNDVYYYGEDHKGGILKAAFASTTQEKGKDLADAFKFNITLAKGSSDEYVITSVKDKNLKVAQKNGVVILTDAVEPMTFTVNKAEAPTSNEGVSTSEVAVVANNGSVVVKNAAGKNVVVSTILGQVVANEVLTSDNATINVPAGIVVVSVDGESFKVNVR